MSNEKVTIIGSGLVGRCWAIVFARGGYNVTLYDTIEAQLSQAIGDIAEKLKQLQHANLLRGQTVDQVLPRIVTNKDLKVALKDSIYAQECIPENLELKIKVYALLDATAAPTTILASSTSSIPASKFTENLRYRNRILVAHPINPPHVIPLVEIVPAPWTDPAVVEKTREIMIKVGNAPVVLNKEVIGFVQNRMQYALLAEAFRLVEDGVLSPGDVDTAVVHGLAARWSFMGPFQTIDLNAPNGVGDYCKRYLSGLYSVLKEQDNSRQYSAATIKKIDDHQRSLYTQDQIPQVAAWRDKRLMALATHHVETKKIDQGLPKAKL